MHYEEHAKYIKSWTLSCCCCLHPSNLHSQHLQLRTLLCLCRTIQKQHHIKTRTSQEPGTAFSLTQQLPCPEKCCCRNINSKSALLPPVKRWTKKERLRSSVLLRVERKFFSLGLPPMALRAQWQSTTTDVGSLLHYGFFFF